MGQAGLLVTIITIVLNDRDHIEQTIKSVLNQVYSPIEYIVIDGGSTDGTIDEISKYSKNIDTFVSEPDGGIYDAINKGLVLSNGSLVGLIHSGDFYEPNAVKNAVEALNQQETDIVYGDIRIMESTTLGNVCRIEKSDHKKLNKRMSIFHPATFVSRECYEGIGIYDAKYKSAADYDFFLRLYLTRRRFFYVAKVLANFRSGGTSGRNFKRSTQEIFNIQKRHIGRLRAIQCMMRRYMIYYYNMTKKVFLTKLIGTQNYDRIKQMFIQE